MTQWLPEAGIDYRWEPRLGGRRAMPDGPGPDTWWQVEAFRAYAAHTRTAEFRAGITDLLADVAASERGATMVMCSETLWWPAIRCTRHTVHPPSPGARVTPDGLV